MTETAPGRRRAPRARLAVGAALATTAVVGGLLLVRQDDDGATRTASTSLPTEPAPTVRASTTLAPTTQTTVTATTTTVEPVLQDGRHAAYLTAVDLANRTVQLDVIQYLGGEEANEAYRRDRPGWTDDAPNDHYIINENPRLRSLAVSGGVEVTLVSTPDGTFVSPYVASFEDLDDIAWYNPFWVTVHDDTIVAIDEQFVP